MKYRYLFLIGIFLFIFQTTVLQNFRIFDVIPNFLLVFTVILVLVYGNPEGLIFGAFVGALQDSFSSKVLSSNILIYCIVALIIGTVGKKLFKDNFVTPIILIAISTFFYYLMMFIFMFLTKNPIHYLGIEFRFTLELIMNIISGFLIYQIVFKKILGYNLR